MPRRPILPADDSAAHAAWIAEAVAAVFHFPRLLPILRRRAEPEPRVPDLFIDLFDALTAQPDPVMPAPAAEAPAPVVAPVTLELTFDMGPFMKAHGKDMIDFEPRIGHPHRVASPPFHLHDEAHTDPVDEFLGQVVGIKAGRALLWRRVDPCVMDGGDVGQRYVLIRSWDDEDGQVWSLPVEGGEDAAVIEAINTTTGLYRGWRRKAA